MKSSSDRQEDIYSHLLEQLVSKDHAYRKLQLALPISKLVKPLEELYSRTGKPAEPVTRGFKCLLLQYWEDLSDRQLERYLRENLWEARDKAIEDEDNDEKDNATYALTCAKV